MLETAIVGGGLCGLALACRLHADGSDFALFEARPRLGGRILSRVTAEGAVVDLGPTWFWPDTQPRIARLIADLGLDSSAQWETGAHLMHAEAGAVPLPLPQQSVHGNARRVTGGMAAVVSALGARLPKGRLHTDHVLSRVRDRGSHVELHFREPNGERFVLARRAILALPPRLVEERVAFAPPLSPCLREALSEIPTWMAAQAKVVTRYDQRFWRDAGYSGTAFARFPGAVLGETWDASNDGGDAAIGAFVALPAAQRAAFAAGLDTLAASHLGQLFGPAAAEGRADYHDWAQEPHTCSALDHGPAALQPDYADADLRRAHWQGKLHFGATETAAYGAGHLEGALEAAGRIHHALSAVRERAA